MVADVMDVFLWNRCTVVNQRVQYAGRLPSATSSFTSPDDVALLAAPAGIPAGASARKAP
jgi:hypothetical protein